jgi:hypothetical protein
VPLTARHRQPDIEQLDDIEYIYLLIDIAMAPMHNDIVHLPS